MVNLNRQIGVSQARQGGFSSHVLPGPVGYQARSPIVMYTDGSSMLSNDPDVTFSLLPGFSGSGGPFDEPYTTPSWRGFIDPAGVKDDDDYTVEAWYRTTTQSVESLFRFGGFGTFEIRGSSRSIQFWPAGQAQNSNLVQAPAVNGQWRHCAFVRKNKKVLAWDHGSLISDRYLNGVFVETMAIGGGFNVPTAPVPNVFECRTSNLSDIGQVRFTIGKALYDTANFTPPTAPFIAV